MFAEYVVADLMTIDPISVSPGARIEDAERLMEIYEVTGLPVVQDDGELVGVISQTDLFREGTNLARLTGREIGRLRVADMMSSPAITVQVFTPLVEAAKLMRERRIHRLVAVSDAGRAVGVLSAMDFVRLYSEDSEH